jgi:glutathione S-transferase
MPQPLLLTMAPSHFSEKARWALQRANVSFEERRNPPLFHRIANRQHGAGKTVPALIVPGSGNQGTLVLGDSTEILRYADSRLAEPFRLYPPDPQQHEQACLMEQRLGYEIGQSVIRFAYSHILSNQEASVRLLTEGIEASWLSWKKRLFAWLFPVVRAGMRFGLKLDAEQATLCWQRVQRAMDDLASQLEDGRPYLLGDRFTVADLTAAALLAPLMLQQGYGGSLLHTSEIPESMRQSQLWVQKHPVRQFVSKIYTQHRQEILGFAAPTRSYYSPRSRSRDRS